MDQQKTMLWRSQKNFSPPVDVIEQLDQIIVLVELAGMQADDFNITLVNQYLVISGTRRRPPLENGAYHQLEIGYGEFRVNVSLPWTIQQDKVTATYRDGFLQVDLPRRAEKQIPIVDIGDQRSAVEQDKLPDDE